MSRDEKAKKQTNKNKKGEAWPLDFDDNSVTGGFNNLYDVLNISVYDVHMFSSACIPVFLFLHLLWEGLVSILWKPFWVCCCCRCFILLFLYLIVVLQVHIKISCCFLRLDDRALIMTTHTRFCSEAFHHPTTVIFEHLIQRRSTRCCPPFPSLPHYLEIHWPIYVDRVNAR